MAAKLILSARGQITLPAELRKKYNMEEGDVIILEEKNGEILLKPAKVFEVEYYNSSQIKEWEQDDQFKAGEKAKLLRKIGSIK